MKKKKTLFRNQSGKLAEKEIIRSEKDRSQWFATLNVSFILYENDHKLNAVLCIFQL